MQILGNEQAFKDKFQDRKVYYETEREKHLGGLKANIEELNDAKKHLFKPLESKLDPNAKLMSPKERREEIFKIKDQLDKYQQFKLNHVKLGHRERSIKSGWRHGVTGIENADSMSTSVMFNEQAVDRHKFNEMMSQRHE